ncbi:MAG: transglycosylase domain-containing protein, partial [Sphingomicrobium sp.]
MRWLLALAVLGLVLIGIAVAVAMASLPDYAQLTRRNDLGQMIRVRAADGSVLVSLGPSFGRWLRYDEIPPTMRSAMIAVEDKRFRSHIGVDPIGIARSLKVRVQTGHFSQGGSTITQQLARNIFLTNNRTFGRKIKEAILALAIERKFSKDQILELYLNRVYFGGGAYGIDAASRTFFGHGADQLSLGEAAIVAGLVKAPSNYSPTADVNAARGRARVVLNSMVENGFITASAAASIDPAQIKVQPSAKQNSVRYFTDWALPQLDTLIDVTSDPIDVWTTLDPNMQAAADRAINANAPTGTQGALVSIDRDGAVRAMVGGRDYVSSIYNRATQAQRQPGSSWKLFVYLAALESGMKPTDTMVDHPVTIGGWSPRNSTRAFAGTVTLREAFARSINTISAQIGDQIGFATIADMARRFGISSTISTYPSMVLGTSDVRLIDMTRAFASVGNGGVSVMPYAIRKVVTADGRLLYTHAPDEARVLVAPYVAAG